MDYNFELINADYLKLINKENFNDFALKVFRYQYKYNAIYKQFADALNIYPETVTDIKEIPFLPVSFYKTHLVSTVNNIGGHSLSFESSGTTGEVTSKHFVKDESIYSASLLQGFRQFYGPPAQYAIVALLPSYLERRNASLVHMAKTLMEESGHPANGFYLDEWAQLSAVLQQLEATGQPAILIGVTFALLDFAAAYPMRLHNIIVMETGGMKGRREEWTRRQVHDFLKQQWELTAVHSEYGMTELLSQAYARHDGIFSPAETMQVFVRAINDPLEVKESGQGCLNIIDLANIHSCSFIATEDIGDVKTDGTFEVLGRMDYAALRGCSLMAI